MNVLQEVTQASICHEKHHFGVCESNYITAFLNFLMNSTPISFSMSWTLWATRRRLRMWEDMGDLQMDSSCGAVWCIQSAQKNQN
jgi:hypothetical protein